MVAPLAMRWVSDTRSKVLRLGSDAGAFSKVEPPSGGFFFLWPPPGLNFGRSSVRSQKYVSQCVDLLEDWISRSSPRQLGGIGTVACRNARCAA